MRSNLKNFPDYYYDVGSKLMYNITNSKHIKAQCREGRSPSWKMKNSVTGWGSFGEKQVLRALHDYLENPLIEEPCLIKRSEYKTFRARSKLVHGVGINDYQGPVIVDRKAIPSYAAWSDMLRRSYCKQRQEQKPYLIGNSVCEEWLTFSEFKNWYDERYFIGCQLDKDLKVEGNKHYSPDNCTLVPRKLNLLFRNTSQENKRHIIISGNRYSVRFKINNKIYTSGTSYEDLDDACSVRDLIKSIVYIEYLRSLIGCYTSYVDNLLLIIINRLTLLIEENEKLIPLIKNKDVLNIYTVYVNQV